MGKSVFIFLVVVLYFDSVVARNICVGKRFDKVLRRYNKCLRKGFESSLGCEYDASKHIRRSRTTSKCAKLEAALTDCGYSCADCWQGLQKDYREDKATTVSGKTCQKWTVQSPQSHSRTVENYPNTGLGDHNYCRNPDDEPEGAWCYTTDPNSRWEYCGIPKC